MKAKIHEVTIWHGGVDYTILTWAQTKQGAIRDALEYLGARATATVATGERLYEAGKCDATILNADKYKNMHDPNQQELPGVTTEGEQ